MTEQSAAGHERPAAHVVAELITALQSTGLRVEVPIGARAGGAGPADAGMLYIEGVQTTVPTSAGYVASSPYVLRGEDDGGWASTATTTGWPPPRSPHAPPITT